MPWLECTRCREFKDQLSDINRHMRNRYFCYYNYNQLVSERSRVNNELLRHEEQAHQDLEPLYDQLTDLRIELREISTQSSTMFVLPDKPDQSMPPGIKLLCERRARYIASTWILFWIFFLYFYLKFIFTLNLF